MGIKEFDYTSSKRIEKPFPESEGIKYLGRRGSRGELVEYLISPGFYVEFIVRGPSRIRVVGEEGQEPEFKTKLEQLLDLKLEVTSREDKIPRDGEGRIIKPGDLANLAV